MLSAKCHLPDLMLYQGAGPQIVLYLPPLLTIALNWLEVKQKRWPFPHNKHPNTISHPNAKSFECDFMGNKVSLTLTQMPCSLTLSSLFVYFFLPFGTICKSLGQYIPYAISWVLLRNYAMKDHLYNLKTKPNCGVDYIRSPGRERLTGSGLAGLTFAQQTVGSHPPGMMNGTMMPDGICGLLLVQGMGLPLI